MRRKYEIKKYKKLYPDYEDDQYNEGKYKHIWGVTSWDNLTGTDACLHTMNDIDITYDRDRKVYMLGVETAYFFKDEREGECKYLKSLLEAFTKFMDDNNYSKDYYTGLFMRDTATYTEAESIEELYANFRIFVEGFCKVYEK